MLESKKGIDATVKLAMLMASLAKPLVTRSRTDDNAKIALVQLMDGADLITKSLVEVDKVFLEREEAAAKRQAGIVKPIARRETPKREAK